MNTRTNTRNKFEEDVELQLKKKKKLKFSYESEKIPYVLYSNYIPDFILETPNGKVYIECKGRFRDTDKRKLAAVKKQHPDIDLRIVFYRENKQYTKWADKHKIPWCIKIIPKEWLK